MTAETLNPDVLIAQTNLSGSVTDIDDDPDSPDGLWLSTSSNNADSIARVSFPSPTGNLTSGAGLQEFRSFVRVTANASNVNFDLYLYENGAVLNGGAPIGSITSNSTAGQLLTGTWDASLLSDQSGVNVEARVYATK